ncbi:MAG: enoyl-CoA hydratase/isomerase family protein [Dehalococcoidia bacterium]|nr:enoyl-CoA hydratase/isomerase family protein [Dehalococcoidia bacterium]
MKYRNLVVEKKGHLMTVTLNRPQILNALNTQTFLELRDLLAVLRADQKTRFVIFTGAGKAFSAGVEFTPQAMQEKYNDPELANERLWQLFAQDLMSAMENLEQVTIAALNGAAIGGALCLAMNCDFRIASEKAILGIPEAALGLFLSWGATPRLITLIGPAKTKELIMTCDPVDANEAMRIGLVNKVVPHEKLMDTCRDLADKISTKGPLAIRICKKQVNAASLSKMADQYPLEPELFERGMESGEPLEGARAFIERRLPKYKNKIKSPAF